MTSRATTPFPLVRGGTLYECSGGPLDGDVVFLPHGDDRVNVGHFFDDVHTPWMGVPSHAPNHLGCYMRSAFVPSVVTWHATPVTEGGTDGGC